jgi:fluoride ion exporter CrcB/FEX
MSYLLPVSSLSSPPFFPASCLFSIFSLSLSISLLLSPTLSHCHSLALPSLLPPPTGFCGSLTTVSTFLLELHQLHVEQSGTHTGTGVGMSAYRSLRYQSTALLTEVIRRAWCLLFYPTLPTIPSVYHYLTLSCHTSYSPSRCLLSFSTSPLPYLIMPYLLFSLTMPSFLLYLPYHTCCSLPGTDLSPSWVECYCRSSCCGEAGHRDHAVKSEERTSEETVRDSAGQDRTGHL